MDNRRIIKNLILILVKIAIAVFLIAALNAVFMPKYINENQDGRITREYYKENTDLDVIFAGSSTVYSGISPMILWRDFGITSYIRSNASQPLWISYFMIKDAIAKNKPKLVVVDVGFAKYNDDYVEEPSSRKSLDGMRLSGNKIDCIRETMGEDEMMVDYILPIFRFHSRWKELTLDDFKYAFYNKPVTYNGHIMDLRIEPMQARKAGYDAREEEFLGARSVYYLQKIADLCYEENIKLLFIKMPGNYDNWSDSYDRQIMNEVCEGKDVGYINFDYLADAMGLDFNYHSTDGGQHLNTVGAEIFSEYLGNVFSEYYVLTDHREDEKLSRIWQEKLDRYEADKAAIFSGSEAE